MSTGVKLLLGGCIGIVLLIGGCFVLIGVIMNNARTREAGAKSGAITTSPASEPGSSAAAVIPDTATSKWRTESGASQMDDSPTETLYLDSENEITGWLAHERPKLVIRCRERTVDVAVITGMPANPEVGLFNSYSVRIRLDDGAPVKQRWTGSTNNQSLFAPSGLRFAQQISHARTLLFEFTPFNASSATAAFDVRGLDSLLPKVEAACKGHRGK